MKYGTLLLGGARFEGEPWPVIVTVRGVVNHQGFWVSEGEDYRMERKLRGATVALVAKLRASGKRMIRSGTFCARFASGKVT